MLCFGFVGVFGGFFITGLCLEGRRNLITCLVVPGLGIGKRNCVFGKGKATAKGVRCDLPDACAWGHPIVQSQRGTSCIRCWILNPSGMA